MRNSVIVWRGPSAWDGSPIRVQLVLHSSNRKTGDVVQAYILADHVAPLDVMRSGADASICGDCPLSGLQPDGSRTGRACYVNVGHGPTATWEAQPAQVSLWDAAVMLQGRGLRIGAYGDPAMVPLDVWEFCANQSRTWTAYTHQWARLTPQWRDICMASVDTEDQAVEARAFGWRTFRASHDGEPMPGEVVCPNATRGVQCAQCGLCNGTGYGMRSGVKSIVIAAHGAGKNHIH